MVNPREAIRNSLNANALADGRKKIDALNQKFEDMQKKNAQLFCSIQKVHKEMDELRKHSENLKQEVSNHHSPTHLTPNLQSGIEPISLLLANEFVRIS